MKLEFDIQLIEKDLFDFNIYQIYRSAQGIVSILLAIIVWVMSAVTFSNGSIAYGVMYIVGGFVFLLYIPVSLKLRVKVTLKTNEVLSGVLHYEVTEDAICVSQGEEKAELKWEQIYKFVANKKRVLVYSNRVNAYIIPREQITDKYDDFVEIAKSKLEKYRLIIKK